MGFVFAGYEYSLNTLHKIESITISNTLKVAGVEEMIAGAMAGIFAKLSVYPLDTVRRRLQVQGPAIRTGYAAVQTAEYRQDQQKTFAVMVRLVRDEGLICLWRGVVPAILKASLSSSVTFLVYGMVGRMLNT
jgi:solute carrier family 25 thiamine pyrophosphate transporter 19